jgi:hypothetical protein
MKLKKISTLKKKAWRFFSEYIRLRDCLFTTGTLTHGKCITCGVRLPFKDLQAGHFISGRHNSYLFDEECTHAQCRTCNILKGGNPLEYRRQIIDLYGDGYDEVLEKRSHEIKKFTVEELENLIKELKEKISKLRWE